MDIKTFNDILDVSKEGKFVVKGSAEMEALQDLMKRTGLSNDRADHVAMGAAVREPIRTLSRYKAWTQNFFSDWPVAWGEDNRIPLDSPIATAFVTSPEGRVEWITPGVQQWIRPSFTTIKAGVRIYWSTLQTAGWPILQRRMEEAADSMALRKDAVMKALLDAAAVSVSHTDTVSTTMTKAKFDGFITGAAQIGYQITQVAMNPGRAADMSTWTNGSTSAWPVAVFPEEARQQVFKTLMFTGYLNLSYFLSHNIPMNTVYFAGGPDTIGYLQHHGAAQSASDIDIDDGVDKHMVREDVAGYVGNPYSVWRLTVT